jgi:hypothetical protein
MRQVALAALVVLALAGAALAETFTWDGTVVDGAWSAGASWVGAAAPTGLDTDDLVLGGSSTYTSWVDAAGPDPWITHSLTFDTSAGLTVAQTNLNGISLSGSGAAITQLNAGTISLNSALYLNANVTFGGAGTGVVTIGGSISGPGALIKSDGSTFTITATSVTHAATKITGGVLSWVTGTDITTFGNSVIEVAGGTFQHLLASTAGDTTVMTTTNNIVITGSGTIQGSRGNNYFNGGIYLAGDLVAGYTDPSGGYRAVMHLGTTAGSMLTVDQSADGLRRIRAGGNDAYSNYIHANIINDPDVAHTATNALRLAPAAYTSGWLILDGNNTGFSNGFVIESCTGNSRGVAFNGANSLGSNLVTVQDGARLRLGYAYTLANTQIIVGSGSYLISAADGSLNNANGYQLAYNSILGFEGVTQTYTPGLVIGSTDGVTPGIREIYIGGTTTFAGGISQSVTNSTLIKSGTGRLVIGDTNDPTHSNTIINGGTIQWAMSTTGISAHTMFGSGTITLQNGGNFWKTYPGNNGPTQLSNPLVFIGSGRVIIARGSTNITGTITLSGQATIGGGHGSGDWDYSYSGNANVSSTIVVDQDPANTTDRRLNVTGNACNSTFSGLITDGAGAGTFPLKLKTNNYYGTMTLSGSLMWANGTVFEHGGGGKFSITSTNGLPAGPVTIQGNVTFAYASSNNITIPNNITVTSGGSPAIGVGADKLAHFTGTLDYGSQGLSFVGPGIASIEGAVSNAGTATLTAGAVEVTAAGTSKWNYIYMNGGGIVLNGLSLAEFDSTFSGRWTASTTGAPIFYGRGTPVTLSGAAWNTTSFDKNFTLGNSLVVNGTYYIDRPTTLAVDTVLTANREWTFAPTGPGLTGTGGVIHRLGGTISGAFAPTFRGSSISGSQIAEVVLVGSNIWTGAAANARNFTSTGTGGMAIHYNVDEVFVRFGNPDTFVRPGGSDPTGNYYVCNPRFGQGYRRGYMITATGGSGYTYNLPPNTKIVLGWADKDATNSIFGSASDDGNGGTAIFEDSQIVLHHSRDLTAGFTEGLFVRDGSLVLGTAGKPVTFEASAALADVANPLQNLDNSTGYRTLSVRGSGVVVMANVDFRQSGVNATAVSTAISNTGQYRFSIDGGSLYYNQNKTDTTFGQVIVNSGILGGTGVMHIDGVATGTGLRLNSGAVLVPGYTGLGTFTVDSNMAVTIGGAALNFELGAGVGDQFIVNNAIDISTTSTLNLAYLPGFVNGDYTLMTYTSLSGLANLTYAALPTNYALVETGTQLILDYTAPVTNVAATWNVDADGMFLTDGNWTPSAPKTADSTAMFGSVVTTNCLITVDAPVVLASMAFDNANSYTIAGSGITLSGTAVGIAVTNGSHTISAPVALTAATPVTVQAGAALTMGDISGSSDLTKAGEGTLKLVGLVTNSGITNVNAGTLIVNGTFDVSASALNIGTSCTLGGNGTINRPVVAAASAIIAPGESIGTLSAASVSMAAGSLLDIQITDGSADRLAVAGTFDVAGDLKVTYSTSTVVASTQTYSVATFASVNGAFANVTVDAQFAGHVIGDLYIAKGMDADSYDVTVKPFMAGDANLDGQVKIGDLVTLAQHWNQASGATWFDGDANGDGQIKIGDLVALAQNWNKTVTAGGAVPEPLTLTVLGLGGLAVLRRRSGK